VFRPFAFGRRFARRGLNYAKVVAWLLRETFEGHRGTTVGLLTFSGIYLAAQAAAVAILYFYARLLQEDGSLTLFGTDLPARDTPALLWAVVGFSTLFFLLSAAFIFLVRHLTMEVVEHYYRRRLEQLLDFAGRLPDPRAPAASRTLAEFGVNRLSSDCRQSAMAARACAYVIPSAIGGTGAAAILFLFDIRLTLVILALAVLLGTFLYPVTLRGAHFAQRMERALSLLRQDVERLRYRKGAGMPSRSTESAAMMAKAFAGRIRILDESTLVLQVGATIVVATAVFYVTTAMMAGDYDWASLIAYLGALRLALAGFAQTARALASVSRFYPQIVRYLLFARNARQIESTPFGTTRRGDAVVLGALPDGTDVTVQAGDRLALATVEPAWKLEALFLAAHSPASGLPLRSVMADVDSGTKPSPREQDAGIVLLEEGRLALLPPNQMKGLLASLADSIMIVVYRVANRVGAFGESSLLVAEEGELKHFLPLGTSESDAALDAVSRWSAAEADRKAAREISDVEEVDDI
jgi:hypothetical protein